MDDFVPNQLTDDGITTFINRLVDYIDRHPLIIENGEVSDEGFTHLATYIFQELSPYSNGYVNFN